MPRSPLIRSDELRSQNRRRMLDFLRTAGPCTSARLVEKTGLSAASISTLSSQLIDQGILLSEKHPDAGGKNSRGRPRSLLSLNPDAGDVITVNLTIDMIRAQRINYAGTITHQQDTVLDTRALSVEQLLQITTDAVNTLCEAGARERIQHIGVAFQGITEHASGDLLWSPIITHRNVPLGRVLQEHFKVAVSVNNDCRLITHALSITHAESLGSSFATVLFTHGIGLGLYLDAKPFAGTRSSALELGHMRFEPNGALCRCGKRGCIEAYSADYGIERLANGQSVDDLPAGRVSATSMQHLVTQALDGERAAVQAFTIAGAAIGEGLVNLFTLLDPMPVALVGHSDEAFGLMQGGINTVLRRNLRDDVDITDILHCFNNEDPLLDNGLILNSLSEVDRLFSNPATNLSISA